MRRLCWFVRLFRIFYRQIGWRALRHAYYMSAFLTCLENAIYNHQHETDPH